MTTTMSEIRIERTPGGHVRLYLPPTASHSAWLTPYTARQLALALLRAALAQVTPATRLTNIYELRRALESYLEDAVRAARKERLSWDRIKGLTAVYDKATLDWWKRKTDAA